MLLLKLPKFGIDIEGTAKIGLPLLVSILREISIIGIGGRGNTDINHITEHFFLLLLRSKDSKLGINNKRLKEEAIIAYCIHFPSILFTVFCEPVSV